MANLDLSQSVGGLTAASRFLRMLIAPNILKAARVDRSDQNLALRDLRWVEEDRGSEIDRGEVDVIVGEIIESDVGEMGRGRARPSERASGLETDGMTQTDGRGRTKGFVGDAEGLHTVTTRLSPSLYKLTAVTLNGSGPVRRAYCVLGGLEIEAKQEQ